jgi:cell shape-determining protein MreC
VGLVGQLGGSKQGKLRLEGHLALNLKRKVRELQAAVALKHEENEALRRNIKSTKFTEIEVEIKMYMDECTRLRHQLQEVIQSKDTFADPEELKLIEAKFQQQELLINQLRSENAELAGAYGKKEEENR